MKVVIDKAVQDKVLYWVHKAGKDEISGLGSIVIEPDETLRVVSAMLLPQKNGAAHTDIEPEAVCKALFELRDSPGDLKWWWHSHVDMGVFWSGTDIDTIKSFGNGGWIVATVFNKKNEKKTAFYSKDGQTTPFGQKPLFLDDLELSVMQPVTDVTLWDAEFEKNVTKERFVTPPTMWPGMDGVGREYDDDGYYDYHGVYHSFNSPTVSEKRIWTPSSRSLYPIGTAKTHLSKKEKRELRKIQKENKNPGVDAYGFSRRDWLDLTGSGYDIGMIDALIIDGFTGAQILSLAKDGLNYQEILDLQTQGFTNADILTDASFGTPSREVIQ